MILLALALAQEVDRMTVRPPTSEEIRKIEAAAPDVKLPSGKKLLVLGQRTSHYPVAFCEVAMKALAKTGAFEAVISDDPAALDRLGEFDALLVNNWHGWDPFKGKPERRQALLDFVAGGKGLAGIHAAAVGLNDWTEWGELIGARYQALPYFEADVAVVEHPLTTSFGGKGFRLADEFYELKAPYDRSKLTMLLEVDREKMKDVAKSSKYGKLVRTDGDYGLAWTKTWGKGRVFYCALGHYETTYMDPAMMRFFLDGIRYALTD
ncbi:MAG TPA: ThuA domain-containing protein [Planctomycetota bacterium]